MLKKGIDALLAGINNPDYGEMIINELFPLLLPGKKLSSISDVKHELIKVFHETLE
jgi:hypothetical protein